MENGKVGVTWNAWITWNRACSFCYGEAAQPYLPPLNAQFTETLQTENFTCSIPLTLLLHGRSKLPMRSKLPHFTLLNSNKIIGNKQFATF